MRSSISYDVQSRWWRQRLTQVLQKPQSKFCTYVILSLKTVSVLSLKKSDRSLNTCYCLIELSLLNVVVKFAWHRPYFKDTIFHLCNQAIWSHIWLLYVNSWILHRKSFTWQAYLPTTRHNADIDCFLHHGTRVVLDQVCLKIYCESFTFNVRKLFNCISRHCSSSSNSSQLPLQKTELICGVREYVEADFA